MGIIAQAAALLPLRLGCPARLPDAAPPPFASLRGRAGADPRKGGRGREKGNPACPHSLPSNKPRAQQHHDPGLKVPAGGGASGQAVGDVNGRSVNGGVAGAAKPVLQAAPQRRRAPYDVEDEAWGLIRESVVRYCGSPVGTIAACDPNDASPLNYDQVFIRDFVPSGIAFLFKGEYDIVRNFILHTLQLQSWEKTMDCHSPGQGLMPASFKVRAIPLDGDDDAVEEILDPDFGEAAIGRVAPVDSGLWWIILLRAYGKCSGDLSVQERIDVQTGIKMILKLCLADGFDMFPTLLVTDGSCMIDRRMGIHGHPLEIQALFYSALLCAREMLTPEDGSADLIRALNSRLIALSFHIREYYWLDKRKLNEIYRYKTEEYSYDAVNKFNIYPDQIHPWLVEWIPPEGGYFIGNLQPAHMDFRFFSLGNLWSIVSSLATTHQSHAILDLIEVKWSDLVAKTEMFLKGKEWFVDYFKSFADMEYSDAQKLENPVLRHYVIFSTNLLASSMTINSTVINSEESANEVFHLVIDAQNFYTFKNWFIRNSYKEATIGVLNFDDFQVKHLDNREVEQLSPSEVAKVSILIGLFKLLMTGVAVFKVDNLERRPLLIGGVGGIASSLFLLAAYYKILIFQQKRGGLLTSTLGKCVLLCAYKLKAQAGYLGAWEFQMTWDPGGLVLLPTSWHRLEDKPKFKEGGMSWTGNGLCPGLCVHGLDLVTAQVGGRGSIRAVATAAGGAWKKLSSCLGSLPPHCSSSPILLQFFSLKFWLFFQSSFFYFPVLIPIPEIVSPNTDILSWN